MRVTAVLDRKQLFGAAQQRAAQQVGAQRTSKELGLFANLVGLLEALLFSCEILFSFLVE